MIVLFDAVILLLSVVVSVVVIFEFIKLGRNHVPMLQDCDKRFCKIENRYIHKMWTVEMR